MVNIRIHLTYGTLNVNRWFLYVENSERSPRVDSSWSKKQKIYKLLMSSNNSTYPIFKKSIEYKKITLSETPKN
jgi:hypothetical protein